MVNVNASSKPVVPYVRTRREKELEAAVIGLREQISALEEFVLTDLPLPVSVRLVAALKELGGALALAEDLDSGSVHSNMTRATDEGGA